MTHTPTIKRRTVTLANGYQYVRMTAECKNCGKNISKREGEPDWMHANRGRPMMLCDDWQTRAEAA